MQAARRPLRWRNDLTDTDLTGADLRGADLSLARNLSASTLRRARYSPTTRWPARFDPAAHGAVARPR